ncbi:hypothetical protein JCM10213_002101 [Rhodosporidiobolus nylandii]
MFADAGTPANGTALSQATRTDEEEHEVPSKQNGDEHALEHLERDDTRGGTADGEKGERDERLLKGERFDRGTVLLLLGVKLGGLYAVCGPPPSFLSPSLLLSSIALSRPTRLPFVSVLQVGVASSFVSPACSSFVTVGPVAPEALRLLTTFSRSSSPSPSSSSLAETSSSPPPSSTSASPSSPTAVAGNASSAAAEQATASPSAFVLPGRSLAVLPIGLGVFGGVAAVALIIVALVTYERRKYRSQFTRRRAQQQREAALAPADGFPPTRTLEISLPIGAGGVEDYGAAHERLAMRDARV